MRTEFERLLRSVAPEYGVTLDDRQVDLLGRHYELMLKWNAKTNLTRVTAPEDAARFHVLESCFAARFLESAESVVDIGSGAGFPGIPVAVAHPNQSVSLVEAHTKKATFLKEAARVCELANVSVRNERFSGDSVSSRAAITARAVEKFESLIPAFLSSPSPLVVLIGDERLFSLFAAKRPSLYPIPHADGRFVAVFDRSVPRETAP